MRKYILEVPLDDFTLEEIKDKVVNNQRVFQVFINIHKIVLFHERRELALIFSDKESICSADGRWIEFLARFKRFTPKERFGGLEVVYKFISLVEEHPFKIFLLGGHRQVLDKVERILHSKFPHAKIIGAMDGFFQSEDRVIEEIKDKKPEVLFLALPSPQKEILGFKIFKEVDSLKYVAGVGGAFDVIAGEFKRAPKIMQYVGFEWFWRCLFNVRLFKRYIYDFFYVLRLIVGSMEITK